MPKNVKAYLLHMFILNKQIKPEIDISWSPVHLIIFMNMYRMKQIISMIIWLSHTRILVVPLIKKKKKVTLNHIYYHIFCHIMHTFETKELLEFTGAHYMPALKIRLQIRKARWSWVKISTLISTKSTLHTLWA